ncbi:PREDICTED: DNA replication factor Cdt1 [Dufourea novaeangliae]|uniref:DNA replication factor Cdt1 n=1 Tax=Dufourea novaeangliae TaxID=178035 RepID=A0A154P0Q6_DUFNO|nr:PREDICTED: DNA replication factor Cdt1 [Dufourea novaeangliae]KZC04828.1 DNA replication factor Cdt1 [Dufourea novaeangliae]
MSQPSVTAYFNTRKRQATDDLRSKAKVLLLERDQSRLVSNQNRNSLNKDCSESSGSLTPIREDETMGTSPKVVLVPGKELVGSRTVKSNSAVRNIQFDSPKANAQKTPKSNAKPRAVRSRKLSGQEGQTDIRDSFQKIAEDLDVNKVLFEKKGTLSPKKKPPGTPKKNTASTDISNVQSAVNCTTPKKESTMDRLAKQELSLTEIKNRINKSARLMELKASIARFRNCEQKLEKLQKQNEVKKPQIQKFEKIQLEIPVSPQKAYKSPSKIRLSPMKNKELLAASPQKRILFEPKESTPSPVKSSPTKAPAYQQYLSLAESGTPALPLPYNYRFLAEAFRCVDTVSAMLFNRKEIITFKKLKPAVQELLRKNFTLEHLAQIKTIYPNAYNYNQEKHRTFGSTSKQDKYELVLSPVVEEKSGRNTPDADDVLKTAAAVSMGPKVLLDRRRKFYNILLDKVKDEHEKFLLSLETPMRVPKEKILRWHPEFDIESCKLMEQSELPQPPNVEKLTSAKDVLDKAKSLFNCGTRMEKALQRLADAKMTSKASPEKDEKSASTETEDGLRKVNISVVDTPPATPTTQSSYLSVAFKGIPKSLLEKVRAKQAAKALEAMTRTPDANKKAAMYSRLPELSKILRNIFVAEKKGVLAMEFVVEKLENSFKAKLSPNELEEHIRLLCKLLPTWTSIHNVRKVDHLKLQKEVDLGKVIKRLEIMANDKVRST